MAKFRTTPPYYDQLDPGLARPTRLFIVTLLAQLQWCEFYAIRDAVEMGAAPLSCHLATLRVDGYIESHGEGRSSHWRLTPLGSKRLTEHLDTLHTAMTRAKEIRVRGNRRTGGQIIKRWAGAYWSDGYRVSAPEPSPVRSGRLVTRR